MISASRCIDPAIQTSYIARNGGSGTNLTGFFRSQTAVGNSKTEVEASWLKAKGGSGAQLSELWGTYLGTKGFTTGSIEERMQAFFLTGTQA